MWGTEINPNDFTIEYYLDRKYEGQVDKFDYPFLASKIRLKLRRIGSFKHSIVNKTIFVYVDEEDNLWYKNPCMFSGGQYNKEKECFSYWAMAGWSKISGVKEKIEYDYGITAIKSAIALHIIETEGNISQSYEDILLESLKIYKEYNWKSRQVVAAEVDTRVEQKIAWDHLLKLLFDRMTQNKRGIKEMNKKENKELEREEIKRYPITEFLETTAFEMDEDLENRFTYHKPDSEDTVKFERIREMARQYAYILKNDCPSSRELSLALTKLEEVVFYANAAIARHKRGE